MIIIKDSIKNYIQKSIVIPLSLKIFFNLLNADLLSIMNCMKLEPSLFFEIFN